MKVLEEGIHTHVHSLRTRLCMHISYILQDCILNVPCRLDVRARRLNSDMFSAHGSKLTTWPFFLAIVSLQPIL